MFIPQGVCDVLETQIRVDTASIEYVRRGCWCQFLLGLDRV